MAWRPRKSISLGKGFRINLSRRGIGWSAGIPRYFRFGIGADRRGRSSIGSGLFRQEFYHGKSNGGSGGGGCCGCIGVAIAVFFGLAFIAALLVPTEPDRPKSNHDVVEKVDLEVGVRPVDPNNTALLRPISPEVASAESLLIPTPSRSWRSADGRTLVGRVTEIDFEADTITIERTDGQTFKNFPISKFHPEDAELLRAAK